MNQNHNKRALIVSSDDTWECLWVDKELITQYHQVEEGYDRGLWFLALAEKHDLRYSDFQQAHTNQQGETYLAEVGEFPDDYNELLPLIDFQDLEDAPHIP